MKIENQLAGLKSDSPAVRRRAEKRLIALGRDVIAPLADAAKGSDTLMRCKIVMLMGQLHYAETFDFIIQFLADTDRDVKYDTIVALGKLGDERALSILSGFILGENSSELSSAAVMSLSKLGQSSKESVVREMAAQAQIAHSVGKRNIARVLGQLMGDEPFQLLLELLKDDDISVAIDALESITEHPKHLSCPVISDLLRSNRTQLAEMARSLYADNGCDQIIPDASLKKK